MIAQIFAPIYVNVINEETKKKYGFKDNTMYLAHAVDVYEDEQDQSKDETRFLMSDANGQWVWVLMQHTKKAPVPRVQSTGPR